MVYVAFYATNVHIIKLQITRSLAFLEKYI